MTPPRDYDSTVARIAGNLLAGRPMNDLQLIQKAVISARAIVAETRRTEPKEPKA